LMQSYRDSILSGWLLDGHRFIQRNYLFDCF
jgi:hypothetical protein